LRSRSSSVASVRSAGGRDDRIHACHFDCDGDVRPRGEVIHELEGLWNGYVAHKSAPLCPFALPPLLVQGASGVLPASRTRR
jgi:hypothetical protein